MKSARESPKISPSEARKDPGIAATIFDLEKARAICEAATKADYIFQDEQPDGDEDGDGGEYYKTGEILIVRDKTDINAEPESIGQLNHQNDAEFFCQARKMFPEAIAEIERLRAVIKNQNKLEDSAFEGIKIKDAEAAHRECQECDDEFCDEDECPRAMIDGSGTGSVELEEVV